MFNFNQLEVQKNRTKLQLFFVLHKTFINLSRLWYSRTIYKNVLPARILMEQYYYICIIFFDNNIYGKEFFGKRKRYIELQ